MRAGFIDETEEAHARAGTAAIVEAVEQRAWPFNQPWHDWRPDPLWGPADLPEDHRPYDICPSLGVQRIW